MADDQENERMRNRVVDMYKEFISEIDPKDVIDLLFQKRIISFEKKEEVMSKMTTNDRCRVLLDHLLRSSNKEALVVLKQALQEHYPWIIPRIDATDSSSGEHKVEPCEICSKMKETEEVPEATMRCLSCSENYCLRCSKIHKNQKLTKDHKMVEYKSSFINNDELKAMFQFRNCKKHGDKVLDYYCCDCKAVVCVSCFVEDHKLHDCKDVKSADKDIREKLSRSCAEMSDYLDELISKQLDVERQNSEFITKTLETENSIRTKNQQLKSLIDQHTQALIDELLSLKQKHVQNFQMEIEEAGRLTAAVESYMIFCTDLKSKGSARDVCGCVEDFIKKEKELFKECKEYLLTPDKSVEIVFNATDTNAVFSFYIDSIVGNLSESVTQFQSHAFVIGRSEGENPSTPNEVVRVNLKRPEDVTSLPSVGLPSKMSSEGAAAVYCNSIFIAGIGNKSNEIWEFDSVSSSWKQRAFLIRGRRKHSVAFVNQVLYICGGFVDFNRSVLDDVEVYDIIGDKSTSVGKIKYAVHSSGNCVPFKESLYIFGGCDVKDNLLSSVQVFDTKSNTCSLLSKPIPTADAFARAVLWNNSVILLSCVSCSLYNFETDSWQVRDQFKTEIYHFGMTAANGKIFVIGGGDWATDEGQSVKWKYRDDVRSVPIWNILNNKPIEWKRHAQLPKPSIVFAYGDISILALN